MIACRRILGRFGNGCKQRGFLEIEVLQRLAEIRPRTGLMTIGSRSEEDVIHIHLEDLVLGVEPLDLQRDRPLVDLTRVGLVLIEEKVSRELLRDRRGPLGCAAGDVLEYGAYNSIWVDTNVIAIAVI